MFAYDFRFPFFRLCNRLLILSLCRENSERCFCFVGLTGAEQHRLTEICAIHWHLLSMGPSGDLANHKNDTIVDAQTLLLTKQHCVQVNMAATDLDPQYTPGLMLSQWGRRNLDVEIRNWQAFEAGLNCTWQRS